LDVKQIKDDKAALLHLLAHVKRRSKRDRDLALAKELELTNAVAVLGAEMAALERSHAAPSREGPRGADDLWRSSAWEDERPVSRPATADLVPGAGQPQRRSMARPASVGVVQPARELRADDMIPDAVAAALHKPKRLVLVRRAGRPPICTSESADALALAPAQCGAEVERTGAESDELAHARAEAQSLAAQLAEAKRQLVLLSMQQANGLERMRRELAAARAAGGGAVAAAQLGAASAAGAHRHERLSGLAVHELESGAPAAAEAAEERAAQRAAQYAAQLAAEQATQLASQLRCETEARRKAEGAAAAAEQARAAAEEAASALRTAAAARDTELDHLALRLADADARASVDRVEAQVLARRLLRQTEAARAAVAELEAARGTLADADRATAAAAQANAALVRERDAAEAALADAAHDPALRGRPTAEAEDASAAAALNTELRAKLAAAEAELAARGEPGWRAELENTGRRRAADGAERSNRRSERNSQSEGEFQNLSRTSPRRRTGATAAEGSAPAARAQAWAEAPVAEPRARAASPASQLQSSDANSFRSGARAGARATHAAAAISATAASPPAAPRSISPTAAAPRSPQLQLVEVRAPRVCGVRCAASRVPRRVRRAHRALVPPHHLLVAFSTYCAGRGPSWTGSCARGSERARSHRPLLHAAQMTLGT
jgi:hypothetical protein